MALAVSQAENGLRTCNREHINNDKSKDIGVFQVNQKWHGHKGNLYDCIENIQVALEIYKASGWNPWTVYKTGAYKRFIMD